MRKLLPANKLLFTITIIIYLSVLSSYGYWDYSYQKNKIMENIDNELYNSASTLKYILPEDFHDRAIDKHAISIKEDKYIANKLTNLVKEAGFKYAYTIIKKDDKLFFVACDLIADPENERETFYYYEYEEADESFFKAFNQEVPIYKTVSDQWGTMRTVMIPEKSPGGVKYLACVDYDISYVKGVLQKNFLRSIVISFFFVFLAVPILIIYTKLHNKYSDSLKESEEKYRSLANNLNVGIYRNSVGSNGRFIEANPAIVKMFGFDNREEFLGLSVSDLYKNPEDRTAYNNELLRENEIKNKELQLQKKDGTVIIGSISAVVVKDKKNNIQYFDGVIEDITERKQMEEELRISEEKYREYFEDNIAGTYISSPEGKLIACNREYKRIFGFDNTQHALDTPINKLFKNSDDRHEFLRLLKKKKRVVGYEPKMRKKDGTPLYLLENSSGTFDEKGTLKYIRGFLMDVTEQKKLEARLQQAQKMESIGTLAGGIAHDFNNILFPIMGHTEMLLEDIPEDSPFQDSLKAIHTSALRAKNLVKQILTFSRQDSSELNLIKIQPIVKEALKLIRSTIPTTIEIKQVISPACGVIKADSTQIHQIVMNLATNAYHAMEKTGGELKVSLNEIELGELDLINPDMTPGVYACLIVADTGVGMGKNVADKIFDPFFTTKAIGKGTGMGLSVVHGIVTIMGGAIQVYSEQGKGTKFHVYFPIEKDSFKELATHSKTQIQGGTEQILIVDDEEAILTMEKQILERLGYQVTSRTSSIDALEAFRTDPEKFDLVITDMAMPNMPGDKLSVELTKICPDIPILLCTGFSEIMSEEKAISLGIKGFLLKPIVIKDLAQKIREVLDEN